MLLACDIGNSSSVFGIFNEEGDIVKTFRVDTPELSSLNDLKKFFAKNFNLKDISGVSISSVVPSIEPVYKDFFNKIQVNPLFISSKIKLNIHICVDKPEKLGSDRIANAGYAYFLNQKFQIVVDLGTALTIDVVNDKGDFLGGIIYPGLSSLAACLYRTAEKLPLVNISKNAEKPQRPIRTNTMDSRLRGNDNSLTGKPQGLIGTNTEMSIMSGIYYGAIFLIEGFIGNICKYYSCDINDLNVIFTGGQSCLLFESINIKGNKISDEFFTLKGIKYLYDLNLR